MLKLYCYKNVRGGNIDVSPIGQNVAKRNVPNETY